MGSRIASRAGNSRMYSENKKEDGSSAIPQLGTCRKRNAASCAFLFYRNSVWRFDVPEMGNLCVAVCRDGVACSFYGGSFGIWHCKKQKASMDGEETVVLRKSVLSSGNGLKYRLLESVSVLGLKFVFDNSEK